MGIVLGEVFGALSNLSGEAIRRRFIEAVNVGGTDFYRATDHAAALMFYQMRILKDEADHPLVLAGSRMAGGSQDREQIAVMIFIASFVRECETRFDN